MALKLGQKGLSNMLKALLEKKASLQTEMRAMSDKVTKETRSFNEDEAKKFAELRAEVESINNTVDEIQKARELDEKGEEKVDGETTTETKEQVEERETRMFANYIRNVVEKRADSNLTLSDSSNAIVPKTVAAKIVARVYDIAPIVAKATKYVTKGSLEIPVYGPNSNVDITMAYADEFVDLESKIGKFTSVELQGYLAGALTKLSNSLINNTDLDLVNFVVERIAYEVARFEEGELLNGTTDKVQGMAGLAAGQIVESAAIGVISTDDLIDLKNKVKQAFRKGAMWVMSTATKTAIEKLKDENGNPLFNQNLTTEFDGAILGYPCYVSDNMADITEGEIAIYFGDFSGLAFKTTEQLEIQVLREKYATQHATGIVAWTEIDAKIENHQKLAALSIKATA